MIISNFIVPLICILLIIIGQKVFSFAARVYSLKQSLGKVKCRPHHWFWGHLRGKHPGEEMLLERFRDMEKYPKSTVLWLGPVIGSLVLYFPSLMQVIMNTEEPKDSFSYGLMKPWIGDGLLISSGKKWKRNRRLLTSAFHFDMLASYLKIFNETASTMVGKWKMKKTVEAFEDVSLMTLDAMLQCAMSSKTNCQLIGTSHPYIKAVYDLSDYISERFFNPVLAIDFIFYNFSSMGKKFTKALDITHEHSESMIKQRKKDLSTEIQENVDISSYKNQSKTSLDFLDILILARDENNKGLSDREIRDEVDTFLFEGHDTTASGISWALYNLARHPEIQERCRQEIKEVVGDRNIIEWEDLKKFEYLTMCIKESLRLHSPVFSISRELTKPLHFEKGFGSDQMNTDPSYSSSVNSGQTFPVGVRVNMQINSLHRNPKVWKNPEVFNPERFTSENVAKRSPYAFLPFSAGSRNCIGQNFAMMEMKVTLALCLKNFKIKVDENFPKPEMLPLVVLRAKNGINLKLHKL